ncbi:Endopolyphosphatase [Patellaria atrata CBS 101060]|uniref:Endopolyphosphatase n=1 Tax=Patellaria atrata CBS 101060 TaxID=1346257 RepID=A0A9P4SII8_9PEZI|nr:Endopolyphosphatase [Patellaria atrata CBS 101060]
MRLATEVALLYLATATCATAGDGFGEPPTTSGTRVGNTGASSTRGERKLHGRFLHITDVHPDPYYKKHSSTDANHACHRGSGPAGAFGAETSSCDTPLKLVDAVFDWLDKEVKDSIDFVLWTGDSARHDNDENIPRSETQVVEQNEMLVEQFVRVFGKQDNINDTDPTNDFIVPIVPTFGNNDILPHNIFSQGPNKWTEKYLHIWKNFIPEEQRHQFVRGGWFYVEAIPDKLAIFSLNTLYFFDSNSATDGCADRKEPGYEHMEWLRIQLQFLRDRGMKALLIGHVPPARTKNKKSWDETCWQKYTLWMHQYRDIIIGTFYGHMNIDHFMLQDFHKVKKSVRDGMMPGDGLTLKTERTPKEDMISIASASDYLLDLRKIWSKLPDPPKLHEKEVLSPWQSFLEYFRKGGKRERRKKFLDKIGGEHAERYSVSHVSPSVVPNYFPTYRIFEYNVTGLEDVILSRPRLASSPKLPQAPLIQRNVNADRNDLHIDEDPDSLAHRKKHSRPKGKRPRKHKFIVPSPPTKSSPPGPAYSPQTLSLLSYTQYFANLTYINNDFHNTPPQPDFSSEYSLTNFSDLAESKAENELTGQRWREGKHHGKEPGKHKKHHPKSFKFEVEYDTRKDKVYGLRDLTVRSYIELASKIGAFKVDNQIKSNAEDGGDDSGNDDTEAQAEADGDENVEAEKKKKKKKHKKHRKGTKVWFTFVRRAFVSTIDPEDIEKEFSGKEAEIEGDGAWEL